MKSGTTIFSLGYVLILLSGLNTLFAQSNSKVDSLKKNVSGEISKQKSSTKEKVVELKQTLLSSLDSIKQDSLKKINQAQLKRKVGESVSKPKLSDSASFKFENGKLQKEHGEFKAPEINSIKIPDKVGNPLEDRSVGLPESGIISPDSLKSKTTQKVKDQQDKIEKMQDRALKVQSKSDSLNALIKDPLQLKSMLNGQDIPQIKEVYSKKKIKKIYDSLGYSRMDSILAMIPKKEIVSEEALIEKLNLPFDQQVPSMPSSVEDVANMDEISQLKDGLGDYDLTKVTLPDSVLGKLPPIRGRQIESKLLSKLDSLREVALNKEKLKLKEKELTADITESVIKKKPSFMDKVYFEGVVSILKTPDSPEIQAAPSLGYKITKDFSIGIGPNILITGNGKDWSVQAGYRSFAKYEVLDQRAYFQVEDVMDPYQVRTESFTSAAHSILAGGGYLLPISKRFAVNFSLLYRVNNQLYSEGKASPWVFRLGFSTIRNRKPKSDLK